MQLRKQTRNRGIYYLYLAYETTADGKIVNSGCIRLAESIAPQQEGTVIIPANIPERGKCFLKVKYLAEVWKWLTGDRQSAGI